MRSKPGQGSRARTADNSTCTSCCWVQRVMLALMILLLTLIQVPQIKRSSKGSFFHVSCQDQVDTPYRKRTQISTGWEDCRSIQKTHRAFHKVQFLNQNRAQGSNVCPAVDERNGSSSDRAVPDSEAELPTSPPAPTGSAHKTHSSPALQK